MDLVYSSDKSKVMLLHVLMLFCMFVSMPYIHVHCIFYNTRSSNYIWEKREQGVLALEFTSTCSLTVLVHFKV